MFIFVIGFAGMTNEGDFVEFTNYYQREEYENPNKEFCKIKSGDIIKITWKLKFKKNNEKHLVFFRKNKKKLEMPEKCVNFFYQKDCFCLCVMYYGYNDPVEFIDEKVFFAN